MTIALARKLITQTINEFFEDKADRLGAALAYYAAFSLSPLLIIVIGVVDHVYGAETIGHVRNQIASFLGSNAADAIVATIRSVNSNNGGGVIATVVGIIVLLIGATGVFTQLQDAMNTIWEVQPKPRRMWAEMLRARMLSFAMVLGVCFLLLVSMLLSAALAAISAHFRDMLPASTQFVWKFADFGLSFAVTTLLFALIYKVLPDVHLQWRDVWLGAAATAVLFTCGKILIALYLGRGSFASAYGAAGSVLVVLAWLYYSAQILFLGAEFTYVYAHNVRRRVRPRRGAILLSERSRVHQGIPHSEVVRSALREKPRDVA